MPTIKYTREDIDKLESELEHLRLYQQYIEEALDILRNAKDNLKNELDQYKTAHNKLTAGLKEAVAESVKYKRERDSLIKDVKKLREEKAAIEMHLDAIKTYKPMYEKLSNKYTNLTEHIRLKALHNPSVSRYKDLMHFIDELEGNCDTQNIIDDMNRSVSDYGV